MLPTRASVVEDVWYKKDMKVFIHSFLKCNDEDQVRMLNKLREISNPVSSSLAGPIEKVIGQISGCKRKLDISSHKNPCAFELIALETDSCSPSMKMVIVQRKHGPKS